ncbi:SGNH/GDSL hydrolase family protein [Microbacterium sp. W1N]|nr:SGNH/GDSL hydrolase family protein [Microbacterium festucae]MCT9820572.1 SGNH/GDSL hydrolase family protein [Microbacterium festucae]
MTATAALAAAGGAVALSGAALRHQARIARRRIGKPLGEEALVADRVWRPRLSGEPIDLLVLGDSIAAGLGAAHRKETLGARVAKGLARRLGRPVRLRTAAVVGSETSALAGQLDALPRDYAPELAVIVVGGNDVTHRIPPARSAAQLADAIARLRRGGAAVVVGTCPDLGALRAVPQPLRALVSRLSRRLAAVQTEVALAHGAHPVSLRRTVGPFFLAQPDEMFSIDRFHPSAVGYRRTAEALVPAALTALAAR